MQIQVIQRRAGCLHGSRPVPYGSRMLVVTHARRKGVGKELKELQELKDTPAPAIPAAAAAAPPPPSPAAATTSPSLPQPPPTAAAVPAAPSTPVAASASGGTSSSAGNGILDNLLLRILGSVLAIMFVINIFYSVVFYGASGAVYVFRDQLAAITKKDFVPYSERRRLEQEVLAKLEADQAERQLVRSEEGSGLEAPAVAGGAAEEDSGSSAELLNLLPKNKK